MSPLPRSAGVFMVTVLLVALLMIFFTPTPTTAMQSVQQINRYPRCDTESAPGKGGPVREDIYYNSNTHPQGYHTRLVLGWTFWRYTRFDLFDYRLTVYSPTRDVLYHVDYIETASYQHTVPIPANLPLGEHIFILRLTNPCTSRFAEASWHLTVHPKITWNMQSFADVAAICNAQITTPAGQFIFPGNLLGNSTADFGGKLANTTFIITPPHHTDVLELAVDRVGTAMLFNLTRDDTTGALTITLLSEEGYSGRVVREMLQWVRFVQGVRNTTQNGVQEEVFHLRIITGVTGDPPQDAVLTIPVLHRGVDLPPLKSEVKSTLTNGNTIVLTLTLDENRAGYVIPFDPTKFWDFSTIPMDTTHPLQITPNNLEFDAALNTLTLKAPIAPSDAHYTIIPTTPLCTADPSAQIVVLLQVRTPPVLVANYDFGGYPITPSCPIGKQHRIFPHFAIADFGEAAASGDGDPYLVGVSFLIKLHDVQPQDFIRTNCTHSNTGLSPIAPWRDTIGEVLLRPSTTQGVRRSMFEEVIRCMIYFRGGTQQPSTTRTTTITASTTFANHPPANVLTTTLSFPRLVSGAERMHNVTLSPPQNVAQRVIPFDLNNYWAPANTPATSNMRIVTPDGALSTDVQYNVATKNFVLMNALSSHDNTFVVVLDDPCGPPYDGMNITLNIFIRVLGVVISHGDATTVGANTMTVGADGLITNGATLCRGFVDQHHEFFGDAVFPHFNITTIPSHEMNSSADVIEEDQQDPLLIGISFLITLPNHVQGKYLFLLPPLYYTAPTPVIMSENNVDDGVVQYVFSAAQPTRGAHVSEFVAAIRSLYYEAPTPSEIITQSFFFSTQTAAPPLVAHNNFTLTYNFVTTFHNPAPFVDVVMPVMMLSAAQNDGTFVVSLPPEQYWNNSQSATQQHISVAYFSNHMQMGETLTTSSYYNLTTGEFFLYDELPAVPATSGHVVHFYNITLFGPCLDVVQPPAITLTFQLRPTNPSISGIDPHRNGLCRVGSSGGGGDDDDVLGEEDGDMRYSQQQYQIFPTLSLAPLSPSAVLPPTTFIITLLSPQQGDVIVFDQDMMLHNMNNNNNKMEISFFNTSFPASTWDNDTATFSLHVPQVVNFVTVDVVENVLKSLVFQSTAHDETFDAPRQFSITTTTPNAELFPPPTTTTTTLTIHTPHQLPTPIPSQPLHTIEVPYDDNSGGYTHFVNLTAHIDLKGTFLTYAAVVHANGTDVDVVQFDLLLEQFVVTRTLQSGVHDGEYFLLLVDACGQAHRFPFILLLTSAPDGPDNGNGNGDGNGDGGNSGDGGNGSDGGGDVDDGSGGGNNNDGDDTGSNGGDDDEYNSGNDGTNTAVSSLRALSPVAVVVVTTLIILMLSSSLLL